MAFTLLSVSLVLPWFRVPVSVREKLHETFAAVFSEPASTILFKIFVLAVLLAACWIACRRRLSGSTGWATPITVSGCVLFAVIGIAYPALTMQRCAGRFRARGMAGSAEL